MSPKLRRPAVALLFLLSVVVLIATFSTGLFGQAAGPQKLIITTAGTGIAGFAGDGGPARYTPLNGPEGVVYDAASGVLYFSDTDNHRVRRVAADGTISTFAGNGSAGYAGDGGPAASARLYYPRQLARDSAGNLYIADQYNHRIRKVSTLGVITTVAGNGAAGFAGDGAAGTAASLNYPEGVAVDASGNIYIGDRSNHRVRMVSIATGNIDTVAGTGTAGYNGDAIAGTAAQLYYPRGLAIHSSGNLLIADSYNHRVRLLIVGGNISTFAGSASAGFLGDGGAATSARLQYPWSVSVDGTNTFIADRNNHRIRVVDGGGIINTFAGNGSATIAGDGGLAINGSVYFPGDVAAAGGVLFIADTSNHRVRRVADSPSNNPVPVIGRLLPQSELINSGAFGLTVYGSNFVPGATVRWNGLDRPTTYVSATHLVASIPDTDITSAGSASVSVFNPTAQGGGGTSGNLTFTIYTTAPTSDGLIITAAGTGIAGFGGDGGPALYSNFNLPSGTAVDGAGNVFVADYYNHRIRKIDASGVITTVAGNGSAGFSGDGGPAVSAQIYYPHDVTVDVAGNLYIADSYNHRIRKVDTSGTITTIAGTGTAGFTGDGGGATSAQLNYPSGVAVDGSGNVYVSDTSNHRIRKISSGNITTIAGNGYAGYFGGDGGPAVNATLYNPYGLTVDGAGNVYVADYNNDRVRQITPGGTITTVAGTGVGGFLGDGGPAVQARISGPLDVTLDAAGKLYITDYFNHRVRMVDSAGTIITYAGNGTQAFSGDGGLAVTAALDNPRGVAVDAAGNLYIADGDNQRLRRVQAASSNNPVPTINTLSPSAKLVGSPAFTMAVYGTNFVPGAVVRWNGAARVTTFFSSTELRAAIQAADVAAAGTATVTAFNPTTGGGGGESGGLPFTIFTAPPASTNLIVTFAGNGIAGFSGDGGPALSSSIYGPIGMAFDGPGNLYVADYYNQRVRRISTTGTITTAAGGGSGGDGGPAISADLGNVYDVAFDSAGNMYIAEYNTHRVRKVATNGTITTIAGTGTAGFQGDGGAATSARLNGPVSVAVDAAGNIYISDYNNHRVRKVTPGGIISTIAGNGIAGFYGDGGPAVNAPLYQPHGLALDGAGNLYIADAANDRIRRVGTDGIIRTVAGTSAGFAGDGGPAVEARLYYPLDVTFDAGGNMYIADYNNHRIRKVDTNGIITTYAGNGTGGFSGDGGLATSAQIYYPHGVAVDGAGNLYIADHSNNRIRRVQPPTSANPVPVLGSLVPAARLVGSGAFTLTVYGSNFVPGAEVRWNGTGRPTTFVSSTQLTAAIPATDVASTGTATLTVFNPTAGGGGGTSNSLTFTIFASAPTSNLLIITFAGSGVAGYSGDGGPALYTSMYYPAGSAIDSAGNLYVAEYYNHRVRKITPAGIITTVAGGGSSFGDGGPATAAQLSYPFDVAVDSAGNLYIADSNNHRIRKVSTAGTITTVAGTGASGFSGDGGPATSAQLNTPYAVEVDSAGNLYISDSNNHRIRKVTGTTITTIAGNGVAGYFGDGGPAVNSPLYSPYGIRLDSAGNLYIADYNNQRIRRVNTNGTISTVAGTGSAGFAGDGAAAVSARLYGPIDVALDGAGNLFIADYHNHRVRMVDPNGIIITVAGTGTAGYSGDGGLAASAMLYNPSGLSIDASGRVYVSEYGTHRVRRLQPPGTSNPVPLLSSMEPASRLAGSAAFTLTVYGGSFVPGAVVRWNGADRVTTFVDSTKLYASIAAGDVAAAGSAAVTVVNPPTGGGASGSLTFTIYTAGAPLSANINTYAGTGTNGFTEGAAASAQFYYPRGLVTDAAGNIYVADYYNHRVRKITPGGVVSTFAGGGGVLGDGGAATSANLAYPADVAIDGAGNIYIVDQYNHRIRKVSTAGIITTVAGNGTSGFSGDGGQATGAQISQPAGIYADGPGNLYIADTNNHRVRKVSVVDGTITTVAGNGIAGFYGDGGPAVNSPLYYPHDVVLDPSGNLLIADRSNDRVRRVSPAGVITTIAGTGSAGFLGDGGPATSARIYNPNALALDAAGNLYIADTYNQRVRRVDANGVITTIAGTGSSAFSGDGGAGTSAALNYPQGVALDAAGNLYIADTNNHRIRVLGSVTGVSCFYTLSALSATHGSPAGSASVTVTTGAGCPWSATTNATWIAVTAGNSGTGTGTVTYSYEENTGTTSRTGTLTIAGHTYTVTQSAPTVCSYSLSGTAASHPEIAGSYSVSVFAQGGCAWTATTATSWITITSGASGTGNGVVNYSITPNPGAGPRSGSITIGGQTFSVTQVGSTAVQGTVTAGAANGAPGGTASVPVILVLQAGVNLDSLSFGVSVTPVGVAPALAANMTFANSASMPAPTLVDTAAGPGFMSVNWSNLASPISGSLIVGTITVPIPSTATIGQAYVVHVTAASGSLSGTAALLSPGADATLGIGTNYMVGDVAPTPSALGDVNGDSQYNETTEFGDGVVNNLDLILALRAITNIPGYTAPDCSDRFDAMDSAPADTAARGGDGVLDNLDLLITLARVVNLDTSRPNRPPRGVVCAAMVRAPLDPVTGEPAGAIELGAEEAGNNGGRRIPVYLNAGANDLALKALSFGLGLAGDAEGRLQFAAGAVRPSMIDDGVSGKLSIAWLEEIEAKAGERLLLGYVEVPADAVAGFGAVRLQFFRVVANSKEDGRRLLLTRPAPPLEVR